LNIVILGIFIIVLNNLRNLGYMHFSTFYLQLATILFSFFVSVVFSFKHIKNLFCNKGRTTIRISKIIFVILLVVILTLPRLLGVVPDILGLRYVYSLVATAYGEFVLYFALWYNLIYALNKEEAFCSNME